MVLSGFIATLLLIGPEPTANSAFPPIDSFSPSDTAGALAPQAASKAVTSTTDPQTPTVTAPANLTEADPATIVVVGRRGHPHGDPLEHINAKSFAITQSVDRALIGPVALAYEKSMPKPLLGGIRNILENLHEPVVFVNFLLQLKPGKAAETLGRFAINSTIGIAGLIDIAKRRPFKLPLRRNGFADTLGVYGVKPGAFLFLPVIGPTTVRDLIGGGLDRALLPVALGSPFSKPLYTVPVGVLSELDRRAQLDAKIEAMRSAQDPYTARRVLYLEQRRSEIDHLRGRLSTCAAGRPASQMPAMAETRQQPAAGPCSSAFRRNVTAISTRKAVR